MKEYKVEIGGLEHTIQLSDEDAGARGLTSSSTSTKQADAPANKSRTASTKKG